MDSGRDSLRASTSHTSLGQSAPRSITDSSDTTYRSRPNSGSVVWVKPLKGGELIQRDTSFGFALSAMSSTSAPPSSQPR